MLSNHVVGGFLLEKVKNSTPLRDFWKDSWITQFPLQRQRADVFVNQCNLRALLLRAGDEFLCISKWIRVLLQSW